MTRKASFDSSSRVLLNACRSFDEHLKAFIKNALNDPQSVHVAARVLFEVRQLENALTDGSAAVGTVTTIPSVEKEDM